MKYSISAPLQVTFVGLKPNSSVGFQLDAKHLVMQSVNHVTSFAPP